MKFNIGELVLVVKKIPSNEEDFYCYLKEGTILRIIEAPQHRGFREVKDYQYAIKELNVESYKQKIFTILDTDVTTNSIVSISQLRDDKIDQILNL